MTTGGGPINATEVLSTYTYKLAFSEYDFSLASASAVLILLMSMVLAVLLRAAPEGEGLTWTTQAGRNAAVPSEPTAPTRIATGCGRRSAPCSR